MISGVTEVVSNRCGNKPTLNQTAASRANSDANVSVFNFKTAIGMQCFGDEFPGGHQSE